MKLAALICTYKAPYESHKNLSVFSENRSQSDSSQICDVIRTLFGSIKPIIISHKVPYIT